MSNLSALIQEQKEWKRVVIFNSEKKVLASKDSDPSQEELQ